MKKRYLFILFAIFGVILSLFYQLSLWAGTLMVIMWVGFYFAYQHALRKTQQCKIQFQEAITYMEQLLYTFQQKKKILGSLLDMEPLFRNSRMGTLIQEVCESISKNEAGNSGFRKGNERIEKEYPSQRIRRIHRFLEHVEEYGGDYEIGLRALQDDLGMYISRTELLMQEKNQIRHRIAFAILISLFICGIGVHFLPREFQIGSSLVSQVASLVLVAINLVMYIVAQEKLLSNWLTENDTKVSAYDLGDYKKVTGEGKRKGIGYEIAFRRSRKVIVREFPVWVLEVVLFLDRGNVQMALANSRPYAHPVLGAEVDVLLRKLAFEPNSIAPYFGFMHQYEISFVQTVMKTLYGISEIGGVEGGTQIGALLSRNQLLTNQSETERNKTSLAGMGLFTLFPMLTGSIKLMLDMVVFILAFLKTMNWGI